MGNFTNGVLVGIGIALLLAPKKGNETRAILNDRIQALRGSAEKSDTLMQLKQKVSDGVQQRTQEFGVRRDDARMRDHAGNPISTNWSNAQPRTNSTEDPLRPDTFNRTNY
ncbi:hypothetical protein KDA_41760 [Dictyobacter alpinus]|uniref:YtxH domain-containing protein n=1 Tax=Dictyobacter alpinus TaxID=2014873 RepID=A0A402BBL3_9CHLR|nr:YtxH domain-containing protein [Dictyobacter alpinus]GCE28692.1 hypothetical protein KDA_41760 [Dictyobacter alpinus]